MRKINDTNELLEMYTECKEEIVSKVKNRIKNAKNNLQKYSITYNTIKDEILAINKCNISDCQCNKLTHLVSEELRKGVE